MRAARACVDHLAASRAEQRALDISDDRSASTRARRSARADRAAGLPGALGPRRPVEDPAFRLMVGVRMHRYYLDPDALRYAARWLDALAERARAREPRLPAFAPMAGGRTR